MKNSVKFSFRLVAAVSAAVMILFSALFCGCKKESDLTRYVSELRSDVFRGESDKIEVSAAYGFKEEPFLNDGKAGTRVYALSFTLKGAEAESADRSVVMIYNGEEYKSTFKLNPLTGVLCAHIEIEGFSLKEFSVEIVTGAEREMVLFKSQLPENTMSFSSALASLEKSQPSLIQNYRNDNGEFTAEIYARVIVKDGAAFWYIGFAEGNDKLKAILLNGATGEVLAVREIM